MLYLVSYDLMVPGKNYDSLWSALGQLGAKRVLESEWLLIHRATANEVWSALRQHVDNNDRLWVSEVTQNMQWSGGKLLITDAEMNALRAQARP